LRISQLHQHQLNRSQAFLNQGQLPQARNVFQDRHCRPQADARWGCKVFLDLTQHLDRARRPTCQQPGGLRDRLGLRPAQFRPEVVSA
jgi:hypothetical protein